ncbi:MAG: hypothetical protein CO108_25410 [Deltaproteobacteria bacterium CG_4_9_14_3_um_filter_63_12]|nr:MAG: hypothetical protein CO108_25410 [Deltaproteobacteria bacterium CG_4_9_14_3_um_filter_63_12]
MRRAGASEDARALETLLPRDDTHFQPTALITARKKAEAEKAALENQLRQAQKLESIGRLAGGVAHDFNNMLAVMLGYSEMARKKGDLARPLHNELEAIHSAAKRSADLTRQLLVFACKQLVNPKVLDLNDCVSAMLKMRCSSGQVVS